MAATISTPQFSFELNSVAHLMRCNFDRRARAHGLSRSIWLVLWQLDREEGLKQASLAERLGVAPISLARQIDRLEQENLVERRRDAADRRCFRLYLTPQARPALELMRRLGEETRAQALAGFSDEQVCQLQVLLNRMRVNLSAEGNGHE